MPSTAKTATSETSVPTTETSELTSPPDSAAPLPSVGEILQDGVHLAYVEGVDVEARTISVDVAQWFSGAAADEAEREDTGDASGAPNDYYIRNESAELRTMRTNAPRVTVAWGLGGPDQHEIGLAEFPAYEGERGGVLGPFWITVEDEVIVDIAEQYVP